MQFRSIRRSVLVSLFLCAGCNLVDPGGAGGGGGAGGSCEAPALDMPARITETKKQIQRDMVAEAEAAGTSVDPDSLLDASGNGALVVAGVTAGLAKVAPSTLTKGVDMGFLYLDLPHDSGGVQPDLPAGYYTLRATASQKVLDAALAASGGEAPDPAATDTAPSVEGAQIDLVDTDGKVTTTLPGRISVWSLDVAPDAAKERPTVEVVSGARSITIWYRCGNGSTICVRIVWKETASYL